MMKWSVLCPHHLCRHPPLQNQRIGWYHHLLDSAIPHTKVGAAKVGAAKVGASTRLSEGVRPPCFRQRSLYHNYKMCICKLCCCCDSTCMALQCMAVATTGTLLAPSELEAGQASSSSPLISEVGVAAETAAARVLPRQVQWRLTVVGIGDLIQAASLDALG